MPGFYADGEYDIAGFIVGVVERTRIIDGRGDRARRRADRAAVGRPAHQRLFARPAGVLRGRGLAAGHVRAASSARRSATRCWRRTVRICRSCSPLLERATGQGDGAHHRRRHHRESAAHSAGRLRGGDRSATRGACRRSFGSCRSAAAIADDEMFRAFNMGIGLIVACCARASRRGSSARCARRRARSHAASAVSSPAIAPSATCGAFTLNRRLAVLISGPRIQSAVDHRRDPRAARSTRRSRSSSRIAQSRRAAARARGRHRDDARSARATTRSRRLRSGARRAADARGVDLVCLAGFMRLVGAAAARGVSRSHPEHPSVAAAGVSRSGRAAAGARARRARQSGATVHLVTPSSTAVRSSCRRPSRCWRTTRVDTLSARILIEEHRIYPEAIAQVLDGAVG